MCLASLLLGGFGWGPCDELVAVRIHEVSEDDLVGVGALGNGAGGSEGEEGSGRDDDLFVHHGGKMWDVSAFAERQESLKR